MNKTTIIILAVAAAVIGFVLYTRRNSVAPLQMGGPVPGAAPAPKAAASSAVTSFAQQGLDAVFSLLGKPAPIAGPANTNGGSTLKAVGGTVAATAAVSGCAAAGGGPACALVAAPAAKVGTVAASTVGKVGSTIAKGASSALSKVKFW